MSSGLRKFAVWLVSFCAVLGIYFVYTHFNATGPVEFGTSSEFVIPDSNSPVGKVGDIGIGTIGKTRFTELNQETRELEREFGFSRLVSQQQNNWRIEGPYMDIYRSDFDCNITADAGIVEVENYLGKAVPKDAVLTGNVVISFAPANSAELTLYLDEIIFDSDRAAYYTDGPIKLISADAQMNGRGLEFVFNPQRERVELLRIEEIYNLKIRTQGSLFGSDESDGRQNAESSSAPGQGEPQVAESSQPDVDRTVYTCFVSGNVRIDSPEQVVFTELLTINNIAGRQNNGRQQQVENEGQKEIQPEIVNENLVVDSEAGDFIEVSSRNGIYLLPSDSPDIDALRAKLESGAVGAEKRQPIFAENHKRAIFTTKKIEHDLLTGRTVANPEPNIVFYAGGIAQESEKSAPVTLSAKNKGVFDPAQNKVVFDGDCKVQTVIDSADFTQNYKITADQLTFDLSKNDSRHDIEKFTADGGIVRLVTLKKNNQSELLGGVELKCSRFDYDAGLNIFTASGPGVLMVNNANVTESEHRGGSSLGLSRKCYAKVSDFSSLSYNIELNRIIVESDQQLFIDYVPIDSESISSAHVAAGRLEIELMEMPDSKTEISQLIADRGVSYTDDENQFSGSRMTYNALDGILEIFGDENYPCLVNGAAVDSAKWNMQTGEIKTQISRPGSLKF